MAITSKTRQDGQARYSVLDPAVKGERRSVLKMQLINLALVTAA